MRIKPTGAYENMRIYYIIIVLNVPQVWVTFVTIYRVVFFGRIF